VGGFGRWRRQGLDNASAEHSVAKRGDASWRGGGEDVRRGGSDRRSASASKSGGRDIRRAAVTRHPRAPSHRIHSRKFMRSWTAPWSCHAPPSNVDCLRFWLDQASPRGQKRDPQSRCHAPPSIRKRWQSWEITSKSWTGCHAPVWACTPVLGIHRPHAAPPPPPPYARSGTRARHARRPRETSVPRDPRARRRARDVVATASEFTPLRARNPA
jgi:hypothetical protein